MSEPHVLLALPDEQEIDRLRGELEEAGITVSIHRGGSPFDGEADPEVDVVLADPDFGGREWLSDAKESPGGPALILLETFGSVRDAVICLREGAFDVLSRPTSRDQLLVAVRRATEQRGLFRENKALRRALDDRLEQEGLLGRDPAMRRVLKTVEAVADTRASVLITGESGTGKTMLAQSIHQRSSRASGPFVVVHCGALPANLLESELFGHAKGSFTGAHADREGKFEAAHLGTIFLDEIGTSPPELQIKLLRVLQDRVVERVGESHAREVDVRILCATNGDLEAMIRRGEFREDLYYRINVVSLDVPPLRERPQDVALLAESFLGRYAKEHDRPARSLGPEALARLMGHPWPGNVRQLQHVIERAVLLCRGPVLRSEDLGPEFAVAGTTDVDVEGSKAPILPLKQALEAPEKRIILRALDACDGHRQRAAALLGVNRTTLFNKMRKYDLLGGPGRGTDERNSA